MQGPPLSVLASFYRGGTSRGLFLSPRTLAPFHPRVRDAIICTAMGSPDPDLRQISGLGGGLSSLSKVAVVGPPDASLAQKLRSLGPEWEFAGVPWADDVEQAKDPKRGWDVVYRFGQVPVTGPQMVDWSSTCGNLVAAVAQYAIESGVIPQAELLRHFESNAQEGSSSSQHHSFIFPLRILAADSGKRVLARVPIAASHLPGSITKNSLFFYPARSGDASIAGVPGTAAEILIESPLDSGLLPSGNARDVVKLADGEEVELTLISTGLPTIFIPPCAISPSFDPSILLSHPSNLDSHPGLHPRLEAIRQAAASQLLGGAISPSAPKICIIAPRTGMAYKTTGGEAVGEDDMDILIRPVSVGNFHRTVPATTLSALAAGSAYASSTITEAIQASQPRDPSSSPSSIRTLTVGHCAGLASASVRVAPASNGEPVPEAIVYVRTARRIVHGWVDLPAFGSAMLDSGADTATESGSSWLPHPRWFESEVQDALGPQSHEEALREIALAGSGPYTRR
ncbi:unnamed protein product [Tilletia controversa]|uniref:DUF453-domain-containing protein n=3 Tax=Tilletia TaxID=13289 RepID=A0A8X7MQJ9_9BASI|nr:hypothetical protein CF336_g7903 [Tilletia laevis]KAE8185886.1 hypothetical protein CF328_g7406 [Tilletia controversa]KAE8245925.1 hypothetical protein A4X03_0g7378 [Tilletia caries]KAE8186566.1 hypothetical protein CF335_g7408 [Tilletia laevis]KAE8243582.1 hypothetical protein A4X06_0g6217 [Tilletia controversa]